MKHTSINAWILQMPIIEKSDKLTSSSAQSKNYKAKNEYGYRMKLQVLSNSINAHYTERE